MSKGVAVFFNNARPLVFTLLSILSLNAYAVDLTENFSINGFYSLHANTTDNENVNLPRTNIFLDDGEVNFDYSLLGLQADYAITNNVSFTVQSIASKQTENSYSPRTKWAYLTVDLGKDLSVRAGQFQIPFMQGTELHYVGFSRIWVWPLVPSSGAGGFNEYMGGEIIKSTTLGDFDLKFQGSVGVADHHQDTIDDGDIVLLSARIEKNESWVNLSLFHAEFDVSTPSGTALERDAEKLMVSLETEQLYGNYLLNLGYVYGQSDTKAGPDEKLAYISLGYRTGRFTPYALYQFNSMQFDPFDRPPLIPGGAQGNGPPPPVPKNGLTENQAYSIGVRYDLGATYAIKAQWQKQIDTDGTNADLGIQRKESNIFTVVLEGVF